MKIDEEKLNKLSKKERIFFDILNSGNSLYLRGAPGTGKSAIALSIAEKLGIKYVDKRLSQIDETDIGLYPVLDDGYKKLEKLIFFYKNGYVSKEEFERLKKSYIENIKVSTLHFAVPDWAFEANTEPTLIHLEELNRANQHVRNASLQLLNERQIGNLKLNDNVFLMSSGNLGEEDGTEVDEMDLALSNRLVIVDHELSYQEWIDEYARKNVWGVIVEYIEKNPGEFYKTPNEKEIRYATPRSWTNLSKFILSKYGEKPNIKKDIIPLLLNYGICFIGNSITKFIRYCEDMTSISIIDIMNKWGEVKDDVSKFSRPKISELITNLRKIDLTKISQLNFENILKFLDSLKDDDELTTYLVYILDSTNKNNEEVNSKIIKHYSKRMIEIKDISTKNLRKID